MKVYSCPICGKKNLISGKFKKNINLKMCDYCRHIFFSALPNENELTKYYENTYANEHEQKKIQINAGQIQYYHNHLKELLNFWGGGGTAVIADYGCAYPTFLIEAKKNDNIIPIGIEHDLEARKVGLKNDIFMFSPNIFFIDYPEDKVDIMRFSHVLEHCENPVEVLKKCAEKIKKKGVIYITQPSFPVMKNDCENVEIRDCVYPEHLHYFNSLSLKIMVEKCGFEIERYFTHTNEFNGYIKYRDCSDIIYGKKKLEHLQKVGDTFFSCYANFPLYYGENSFLIARKM